MSYKGFELTENHIADDGKKVDDLSEIRERLAKATPGRRIATGLPYNGIDDPCVITESGAFIAQTTYDMQSVTQEHNVDADTIFIAHAPADIQNLLDIVDAQRAEDERLHNILAERNVLLDNQDKKIADLTAENALLRKERDAAIKEVNPSCGICKKNDKESCFPSKCILGDYCLFEYDSDYKGRAE